MGFLNDIEPLKQTALAELKAASNSAAPRGGENNAAGRQQARVKVVGGAIRELF